MKKFYEKDLEEIIFNATKEQLESRGLCVDGRMMRQVSVGKYGRIDLLTISRSNYEGEHFEKYLDITIYELKEDKIGIGAFFQAIGYAKGIQKYMEKRRYYNFSLNIVLIGGSIDLSGSFCYLPDLFNTIPLSYTRPSINSITFYTYDYNIDGIIFKDESGYYIPNSL